MKCPRCEIASLEERERDGILVDACPGCRGVWLDRGEIEKLIARATLDGDESGWTRTFAPTRRRRHNAADRRRQAKGTWRRIDSLGDILD